ncbi:MAG: LLM class flavin-dependent oxidoreductase [Candidatus Bathyarchaeota archaeon]|nr:LLM class flavin-dependent oxidoreductase [Candidatus Bathyarchaeota archaeon]
MEFGIVLPISSQRLGWDTILNIAKEAELLGYDSVWVSDHFISPSGSVYTLEPWTVLSALALVTNKIRLGTYVLCNQYRHPSLLAKMTVTLDHISKGRLDLGIGAGWIKAEHETFGFEWKRFNVRLQRLKETLEIIRKLWTENNVSYSGQFFQLKNANLQPKPFQKPHPPVWVGGNSRAIMHIIAELGDGWIPALPTPTQLQEGVSLIEELMKDFGRKNTRLQVAFGGSGCTVIAKDSSKVEKLAEPLVKSMAKPIEDLPCIVGTPEQCIRRIKELQKSGAKKIVAGFMDPPSLEGMRLFAESVIPHFK